MREIHLSRIQTRTIRQLTPFALNMEATFLYAGSLMDVCWGSSSFSHKTALHSRLDLRILRSEDIQRQLISLRVQMQVEYIFFQGGTFKDFQSPRAAEAAGTTGVD